MSEQSRVEQKTGDLYYDCWSFLNEEQWIAQGELLATQLGLDESQVRGRRCFDGGCGHGALDYRLAKLGAAEVVAFDLKPQPKQGHFDALQNVTFAQGSLLRNPYPDGAFDLVVSSGVVHHTENPDQAVAEMVRILKPGGVFILGVYGKHGLFPWLLSLARIFTVHMPIIPESWMRKLCDVLRLDPIWRYQVLDYLYVPILKRYGEQEVKERFFLKHGLADVARVSNLTPETAKTFVQRNASYTYDYRSLPSRILFGHGFIVVRGRKT